MSCVSLKKNKFGSDHGSVMITIGVGIGDKRQTFSIHKALLRKCTKYFDEIKAFDTEAGKKGLIFLNDEDPDVFGMLIDWAYKGGIAKCPTKISVRSKPSLAQIEMLEEDLLRRFNKHLLKLVDLYALAEKYRMEDLMNEAVDNIQDGYLEYGTVFGPGLSRAIFQKSKKNSKIRDLCVGSVVLHMDRGCTKLRAEIMLLCITLPGYMDHMLRWIAQNFHIFGRREREGFSVDRRQTTFSLLNRAKLCSCLFHEHKHGGAHKSHKNCAAPFLECAHPEDNTEDPITKLIFGMGSLMGGLVDMDIQDDWEDEK